MDSLYLELVNLVFEMLKIRCPIMSGNMQDFISIDEVGEGWTRISISGPSYDIGLWDRTKQIRHTGEYDYAIDVNKFGGFYTGNDSMHWANRACADASGIKAREYGGKVAVYVDL